MLFVPKLKKNLFSVGVCSSQGYDVRFSGANVNLFLDKQIVAEEVKQENGIYHMLFVTQKCSECNVIEANVSTLKLKMWHERLGHINKATLSDMIKQGVVSGVKLSDNDDFFCEACELGKSHRLPFKKIVEMKTWLVGESIHTDVGGPMPDSLKGAKYYVMFVDEASGFCNVYFMRHKSDVTSKFKEYEKMVQNKFEKSIKVIRCDNGTEYINKDLSSYFIDKGIQMKNSSPYTPEKNGKSERENRTIIETARTMLKAKDRSNHWPE